MNQLREMPVPRLAVPMPERGARMPCFVDAPEDAAQQLATKRIVVVGCGSVGMRFAEHLVRVGIGAIDAIDPKEFKAESLATHPICADAVGRSKAASVAALCKSISPETRVRWYTGSVQDLSLVEFIGADAVVMATDNLAVEVYVGQLCTHLGLPLFQASVLGETLTAELRSFENKDGHGPCPTCSFTADEWAALNSETTFTCSGEPSASSAPIISGPPTMSISALCSMAADLASIEILKHMLAFGPIVTNCVVSYSGYTQKSFSTALTHSSACPCEHTRYRILRPTGSAKSLSLNDLLIQSRIANQDLHAIDVKLDGLRYVDQSFCACGTTSPVQRFVLAGTLCAACPSCGGTMREDPYYTHTSVTLNSVGRRIYVPLREICPEQKPDYILIRRGDSGVLVLTDGINTWGSTSPGGIHDDSASRKIG